MASGGDIYASSQWRELKKRRMAVARTHDEPCCRCGKEIDYDLRYPDPWAANMDHLEPVAEGGAAIPSFAAVAPAHSRCNSSHGGRLGAARNGKTVKSDISGDRRPLTSGFLSADASPARAQGGISLDVSLPEDHPDSIQEPITWDPLRSWHDVSETLRGQSPPRLFSPPHPQAEGTLGPQAVDWLERNGVMRFRSWQRAVMFRAFEYRASVPDDETDAPIVLLWREGIITTPRQQGKSWLIKAFAIIRAAWPDLFGQEFEPSEILHFANRRAPARRQMLSMKRWAESNDVLVREANGSEALRWPDGAVWELIATTGAWGASAHCVLGDEAWDVDPELIDSGVMPTIVERINPQVMLFSTANDAATALIPGRRLKAMRDPESVFIAEWSAHPHADHEDPAVWRAASPHWSRQRGEIMAGALRTPSFRPQWLNVWPASNHGKAEWPAGWSYCARAAENADAMFGHVAAVEIAPDHSGVGLAYAVPAQDATGRSVIDIVTATAADIGEARDVLARWRPATVVAGLSIKEDFPGPWLVEGYGLKETRQSTPWFDQAVKRGIVRHDHNPVLERQAENARLMESESGVLLSAKKSAGRVDALKCASWAAYHHAEVESKRTQPAIW